MKLLDGLTLRKLGREYIVTGDGPSRIDFSKVVSMNGTAAYLFEQLAGRDFSLEDMVALLTDRYDVSVQTARDDAARLLENWAGAGLLDR